MGYLKEKKRKQLESNILLSTTLILSFLTIFPLFNYKPFAIINTYLLQIYIVSMLFILFALTKKRKRYITISIILFVINYNSINAHANLTNNIKIKSAQKQSVTYKKSNDLFNIDNSIIKVDLSKVADFESALDELEDFVLSQNEPVTVIGDLKKPLWHPQIKDFMQKTGLKAKNKIIFDSFNPFFVPSINVLGFDNIGVEKIIKKNDAYEFILLAK